MRTPILLLAGLLAGLSRPAAAATVTRGPYLQLVTPNSAVVVWRTDVATAGAVRIGSTPGQWARTVTDTGSKKQHEVKVDGLTPDTLYAYAVGTPVDVLAGGTAAHTLRTAPAPATTRPVSVWFLGDSGAGNTAQLDVRNAFRVRVGANLPDFILHLGDIAYDTGTETQFQTRFFDVYANELRQVPIFPTLGNHEGTRSDSATGTGPYYDAFVMPKAAEAGGVASGTEAYYSLDYGPMHVIVLNSQDVLRATTGAMARWLRQDLAATTKPWIVATFHHPAYSKGTHDSDTEGPNMVEMRENLLPILEAGGADLVLAGHSHIYERTPLLNGAYQTPATDTSKILDRAGGDPAVDSPYRKATGSGARGTVYITAGHGGASLGRKGYHPLHIRSEVAYGSCLMTVDRTMLSVINLRRDGVVSDRFTMLKGDAVLVLSPNGGESLAGGTAQEVRWTSGGTIAPLRLEYSSGGGSSWALVADGLPDTGRASWTPPRAAGTRYRVRLTSQRAGGPSDASDADFSVTVGTAATVTAIASGSRWKYRDLASDPGPTWNTASYDDASWKEGAAQLGYGDGDEATTIASGTSTTRPPSAYFRQAFNLVRAPDQARLRVLHDDGVAVFVNGRQVFSKRVSNLAYSAFATSQSAENEVDEVDLDAAALAAFVPGRNVVAAVVKQANASSSDVSFDLSLTVRLPPVPNQAPVIIAPPNVTEVEGTPVSFVVQASDPDGDPLTLTAAGLPVGARFDAGTAAFSWPVTTPGTYDVTFSVSDGTLSASASTRLEIAAKPPPPVPDAGAPDAGTQTSPDAGATIERDAGVPVVPDAGATIEPDAGAPPAPEPDAGDVATTPAPTGCGCGAAPLSTLALLAPWLRRRRRA